MFSSEYDSQFQRISDLYRAGHLPLHATTGSRRTVLVHTTEEGETITELHDSPTCAVLGAILVGKVASQVHLMYTVADVDAFIAAHSV